MWKCKGSILVKTTLKRKEKIKVLTMHDFMIYYKTTVMKIG